MKIRQFGFILSAMVLLSKPMVGFTASLYQQPIDSALVFNLVKSGDVQALQVALTNGTAIADARDNRGYTPLILSAYHGQAAMVRAFIPHTKELNYSSPMGTALMAAVVKGEVEIVAMLLDAGADPNMGDADATIPLILASMFQNEPMARLLMAYGSNPYHKNQKGFSAFDYAQMHQNNALIEVLTAH